MTKEINLDVNLRSKITKTINKKIRKKQKNIIAIIYGKNITPIPIIVEQKKILNIIKNKLLHSKIFKLNVENKFEINTIIKDIQYHQYKKLILNIDFQKIEKSETVKIKIPIKFIGKEKSIGIKMGGTITYQMNEIEIISKIQDIPDHIKIDISNLKINQTIHLRDIKNLKIFDKIKINKIINDNIPITSIIAPRELKKEEEKISKEKEEKEINKTNKKA